MQLFPFSNLPTPASSSSLLYSALIRLRTSCFHCSRRSGGHC